MRMPPRKPGRSKPSISQFLQKFRPQALILDFDGVFTDNKVILSAEGVESVVCDRSDGYAIEQLEKRGFPILVLSTEKVPIVRLRAQKLGLECIHGSDNKAASLKAWLADRGFEAEKTVYVGNDVNDLGCMQMVGLPVAVADAFPEAMAAARVVLEARGGHGAVREVAMAVTRSLDGAQ